MDYVNLNVKEMTNKDLIELANYNGNECDDEETFFGSDRSRRRHQRNNKKTEEKIHFLVVLTKLSRRMEATVEVSSRATKAGCSLSSFISLYNNEEVHPSFPYDFKYSDFLGPEIKKRSIWDSYTDSEDIYCDISTQNEELVCSSSHNLPIFDPPSFPCDKDDSGNCHSISTASDNYPVNHHFSILEDGRKKIQQKLDSMGIDESTSARVTALKRLILDDSVFETLDEEQKALLLKKQKELIRRFGRRRGRRGGKRRQKNSQIAVNLLTQTVTND